MFRIVTVAWVNRGYIAEYRRQNLKTKLAHVHEQREFTYSACLVAAGHLQDVSLTPTNPLKHAILGLTRV